MTLSWEIPLAVLKYPRGNRLSYEALHRLVAHVEVLLSEFHPDPYYKYNPLDVPLISNQLNQDILGLESKGLLTFEVNLDGSSVTLNDAGREKANFVCNLYPELVEAVETAFAKAKSKNDDWLLRAWILTGPALSLQLQRRGA